MAIELKIPAVGESVVEVRVGRWLKKVGDAVERDEEIVEIETDKATLSLPAPASGRLAEIAKPSGEKVQVGDVIARIEQAQAARPAREEAKPAPAPRREGERAPQPAPSAAPRAQPQVAMAPPPDNRAQERAPAAVSAERRREEIVPMSPIRSRIAQRLVEAQHAAALLTTFTEIELSSVNAARERFGEEFQKRHGVRLGIMSFFVKATVEALRQARALNAELRGESIVYRDYFDIGIAVGGGKGLVVPVLRAAERMSFLEIELAIDDFAKRARENRIGPEQLAGGTFTITNGGIYGSLLSTPIVNPPQSGILGLHAIQNRPVARQGQVVVRPMMYAALTYDHRLIDGREAAGFLRRVKETVEDPVRLLIEI